MKTWMKNNIMTTISISAIIVFIISWKVMDIFASTENLPLGYFQKVLYAIIFACIGNGLANLYVKITNPKTHEEINELTDGGINDLPEWERTKVYMWKVTIFIALLIAGIMS